MRSSSRFIAPAAIFAFLALMPITGVFAEDGDVDGGSVEGGQLEPAGADAYTPKPGNLNSVPVDGSTLRELPGTESPLVKQILASRPNEDLVICIAGCFAGRDRVIYAQPSANLLRGSVAPQKLGEADKPSRAAAIDPRTPAIINQTN
ncbi:hypothetical protein [Hyphomicrobium sp.]|jgi:hypothetical protein|uniref:hypothetical protein n=1 Tax=Hyphomicrobium sp. TaxID=82 RepID=UPI0035681959